MGDSKMTMTELVEAVYRKCGHEKHVVSEVIHRAFEEMTKALENDEEVSLRGYANFKTVRSPKRDFFKKGKMVGGLRRVSLTLPRKSKWRNMP